MKDQLQALIERHDAMKKEAFAASEKPGGQIALIRIEVADYYKKLPGLLAEAIAIIEQYTAAPQIVLDSDSLQSAVQKAIEGLMDTSEPAPKTPNKTLNPIPPAGALPINEMIRKATPKEVQRPYYAKVLNAAKNGELTLYGKPRGYKITEEDYLAWLET